jgi:nicotinate phosphoribosyltransferase
MAHSASLALLTDLYQLTMAYGYWKLGRADHEAVFHLIFRRHPFKGGYTVAAGLGPVIEFLENLEFAADDLEYLASLTGNDGRALFEPAFLDFLHGFRFAGDLDAVPEGTVVFPHEPLVRVTGPLWQCQILETALLNLINFQSLIATKAARVCLAAGDDPVLEFGLRRAQGVDGGLGASRAAYIGGCAATSNVLAGKRFGIPVRGTHAHSWVMSFDNELESFDAYAQAMPNNCVFLVDTYGTLDGVRNAISAGRRLRERGYELGGIRLDSGDLAYLSIEARKLLDAAGFEKAAVVASNDLDEYLIESLKTQGAKINVWGVGTRLATAFDQPALGGVYKLTAIRAGGRASRPPSGTRESEGGNDARPPGDWSYKVKVSEQTAKVSTPGILQVRRFRDGQGFLADMIYDIHRGIGAKRVIVDPADATRRRDIPADAPGDDLLLPVFAQGRRVYTPPTLPDIQRRTRAQLAALHPTIRRLVNPHGYPAGLELGLHELRTQMILAARGAT